MKKMFELLAGSNANIFKRASLFANHDRFLAFALHMNNCINLHQGLLLIFPSRFIEIFNGHGQSIWKLFLEFKHSLFANKVADDILFAGIGEILLRKKKRT